MCSSDLAFINSFDEVTMSIFVTSPSTVTLPVRMYMYATESIDPLMAAVSALMVGLTACAMVILDRVYGLDRVLVAGNDGAGFECRVAPPPTGAVGGRGERTGRAGVPVRNVRRLRLALHLRSGRCVRLPPSILNGHCLSFCAPLAPLQLDGRTTPHL